MHSNLRFLLVLTLPPLMLTLTACEPASVSHELIPVEPSLPAERIHAIIEQSEVPPAEFGQSTVSGTVVDTDANVIRVVTEGAAEATTFATAPDMTIWEDGEPVTQTSLKPGDRVDLFSEQRGNRADGYQSLVVRINIDARSHAGQADARDYSRTVRGVVVEADTNAVTLRDPSTPDGPSTILPVVRLVRVSRAGEVGGTELLRPGDPVSLTVVSVGNRMDGYIDTATEVIVE